jgi:arabinogalactan oligomer/maltooligosaccharide transport system substrate-binding protein
MKWQVEDAYHNFHWFSAHGMQLFGADHRDYTQPGWNTPGGIGGAAYLQHLRENLLDVESGDSDWDASVAEFQAGNLPLTISGPWAIESAETNGVNFGVTKLPTINGVQPVCFSGVRLIAMSSFTQVPELAAAFIDWFTGVEGAAYLYEFEGQLPSYRHHAQIPGLSDDAHLMGIGEQSPFTIPMPIIREMQAYWDVHLNVVIYSWNRLLTPEEVGAHALEEYIILLQGMGSDTSNVR